MLIYLIQSSFMPCRFQTFQEPYQTWQIFFRSLETGDAPSFANDEMIAKGWKARLDSLQKGKTLQIYCEIVPIVNFYDFIGSVRKEFILAKIIHHFLSF